MNICVRRLWVGKFIKSIESTPLEEVLRLSFLWDIRRYLFGIFISWGWARIHSISHFDIFKTSWEWMIPCTIQKVVHMCESWNIYLFVTEIIHSTNIQVFLCLVRFVIPCFCQLIDFLTYFWHIGSSQTSTRLLFCVIFIDCYLQVTTPSNSNISSV